ncbi:MAG: FAD synthetase family protein [Clostridiales bacterium]|nr:FAD synthetase family protein [Clostridiales bacterium]
MTRSSDTVIALGMFDGLHAGHMAVINEAISLAKARGARSMVYTFIENPKSVLGRAPVPLMSFEEKLAALKKTGVDEVCAVHFTKALADTSPEDFVSALIRDHSPAAFVCGEDYTFGAKGSGSALTLKQLAGQRGIDTVIMPLVTVTLSPDAAPVKISSTLLRELKQSDIKRQI